MVGGGAATFSRDQQAGDKSTSRSPDRAELRERIIHLRTEVHISQAECDGARSRFLKALELVGVSELAIFDLLAAGAMQIGGRKDAEASAILENIRANGPENLKGVDSGRLSKAVAALARGDKGAAHEVLRTLKGFQNPYSALVERDKAEFARLSTELNRRKLNLSEAEKQYWSEAR
jgi:hypothetical protein